MSITCSACRPKSCRAIETLVSLDPLTDIAAGYKEGGGRNEKCGLAGRSRLHSSPEGRLWTSLRPEKHTSNEGMLSHYLFCFIIRRLDSDIYYRFFRLEPKKFLSHIPGRSPLHSAIVQQYPNKRYRYVTFLCNVSIYERLDTVARQPTQPSPGGICVSTSAKCTGSWFN